MVVPGIAVWLAEAVGEAILGRMVENLFGGFGVGSQPLSERSARALLDEYLDDLRQGQARIESTLAENRVALLEGGLLQLRHAAAAQASAQELLGNAVQQFSQLATLSPSGSTGPVSNRQLQAIAYLGMAASYARMDGAASLVLGCIEAALLADWETAARFLGVREVSRLPRPAEHRSRPAGGGRPRFPVVTGPSATLFAEHLALLRGMLAPDETVIRVGNGRLAMLGGRPKDSGVYLSALRGVYGVADRRIVFVGTARQQQMIHPGGVLRRPRFGEVRGPLTPHSVALGTDLHAEIKTSFLGELLEVTTGGFWLELDGGPLSFVPGTDRPAGAARQLLSDLAARTRRP